MSIGQIYESRKNYIERIAELMSAKRDFLSLQYARSVITHREYIRIRDIFGKALTIDVTDDDLEKILSDMCRVILMGEENVSVPTGYIDDNNIETLRTIAPLFN